jgi:hypothetical protein
MSHAFRLVLAAAVVCMIGCYSIPAPRDVIPDTFPASGPTGMRIGVAYQDLSSSGSFDKTTTEYNFLKGDDATDLWSNGMGGFFEVPIDYNPFLGCLVGVGYDRMSAGSVEGRQVGALNLLPMYGGLTARLPFWLDWSAWAKEEDPIWIPNVPIGPSIYVRALGGGAYTVYNPHVYEDGDTGARTRALDYQVAPFCEGSGGAEYRYKDWGLWAEVGYRYYFLDGGRDQFDVDGLGGMRVSAGISWYGF